MVVVEGVFERYRVIGADRVPFLLETHDDCLRRMGVEKLKDVEKDLFIAETRITIRVIDMQLVIPQPRPDIEIPQPTVQLHAKIPILALQLLRPNLVRHRIVSTGDAQAGEVYVVGNRRHPIRMQVVAGIEAIGGLVASVACRADHAGRNGEEDVEEGHGAEDADGHEDGELAAAARTRLEGFDGEGYGAHDERLAGYVEDGIRMVEQV